MLSHMPQSVSSLSNENRFHFCDLTQRAPQNKGGLTDSGTGTRSKLLPFWSPLFSTYWGNWSRNIGGEECIQDAFISPELLCRNLSLSSHIITGVFTVGPPGKGKVSREMSMQHMQGRASRCDMSASTTLGDEVGDRWRGVGFYWLTGSQHEWDYHLRRVGEKNNHLVTCNCNLCWTCHTLLEVAAFTGESLRASVMIRWPHPHWGQH